MKRAPNFKRGTLKLQKGKITTEHPCSSVFFEVFKANNFFYDFLKEGMRSNVGRMRSDFRS